MLWENVKGIDRNKSPVFVKNNLTKQVILHFCRQILFEGIILSPLKGREKQIIQTLCKIN